MGKSVDFFIFSILLLSMSCNSQDFEVLEWNIYNEYVDNNFENYQQIYMDINDSLSHWKDNNYKITKAIIFNEKWQVDSLFIFNEDSSRFFATLNILNLENRASTVETIEELEGAFINDKWYFYFGSSRIFEREPYKNDPYDPLSLDEISFLSRSKIMSRYLRIENGNSCSIRYDNLYSNFIGGYKSYNGNIQKIDSLILERQIYERRERMNDSEIAKIRKIISERRRPIKNDIERNNLSKLDKVDLKLFDSDAWKNRHKK